MTQKRSWLPLGVGVAAFIAVGFVVFSVGSAVGYFALRSKRPHGRRPLRETTPVLVVAHATPLGRPLAAEDMATRAVPTSIVTADDVKPSEANYLLGQTLRVPLEEGDTLRWAVVDAPGDRDPDIQAAASACAVALQSAPGHPPAAKSAAELRERVLRSKP